MSQLFTLEQLEEAMGEYIGFCTACGREHDCCEPDAREYACEECGALKVYGAEELIFMGLAE